MRISIALLVWFLSAPAFAGTYKWVDENGVTHYSDSIPPEHKDRGNQELNRRGIVIKKTEPALTPEQRKAIDEEKTARALEEEKAAEQKRHDEALRATYASVEEIDLKRERDLQQIAFLIRTLENQRSTAQDRLDKQMKLKPVNEIVPDHLAYDIARSEEKVAALDEQISARRFEESQVQEKYEAHKKRFIELQGTADARPVLPNYVVPTTSDEATKPAPSRPTVKRQKISGKVR
ncbi:MAG: DUF4124 domain-containing protein [Burkholderiales bacterium]